jgi:hypothetical protein
MSAATGPANPHRKRLRNPLHGVTEAELEALKAFSEEEEAFSEANFDERDVFLSAAPEKIPGGKFPKFTEFFIALVVPRRQRDAVLGDLEERFHEDLRVLGYDRALWRYRAEAFKTVVLLLWPKLKRLGIVGLLASAFKQYFG